MIIMDLVQGSEAWHKFRAEHDTASEASIVLQCSKNVTRSELLREKATGSEREFSAWFEKNILEKGHQVEALARPIVEIDIGEELYPVTGKSEDYERLAASFDGITMLGDIVWECKQWNEEKAASVREGKIPECDFWQVVQQLVVSRAEYALYTVSDGTKENTISCRHMLSPGDESELIDAWHQFNEDLENYTPEPAKVDALGKSPESLPSLSIQITGGVQASNLPEFRARAMAIIDGINTDLATDQDFADAAETVKFLLKGEKQLEASKKQALEQTASIADLFDTIDELSETMRKKRLHLNKLVKAEKENRRLEIRNDAIAEFRAFANELDAPVPMSLKAFEPDVAEAMKGKKTIASLKSAADDAVAQAKIALRKEANRLSENKALLEKRQGDYGFLFNNWPSLITEDARYIELQVESRIAHHKQEEQKRIDAERERIRQQEESRIRAEERRKAEEEAKAQAEAHAQRSQAEQPEHGQQHQAPVQQPVAEAQAPSQTANSELGDGQMVEIPQSEYDQLISDSALLNALYEAGLARWSGYEKALHTAANKAA